ncbi:MAG TPA: hypothetical protein VMN76_07650 [Acidobacteriota bacterium]|nr:hypothetical protein [Acidobacteriota bacterium]
MHTKSMRRRWSRRRFLELPLALAALSSRCRRDVIEQDRNEMSDLPVGTIRDLSPDPGWEEGLLQYVGGAELPQEIGRFYLRLTAYGRWEDTPEILLRKILLSLSAVKHDESAEMVELLRRRIQLDFTVDERVCSLDGWYLSRTECRLAALKYLLEQPDS